jgi:(2Fe-2S) ferredoxin
MFIKKPQQFEQLRKECIAEQQKYPRKVLICCGPGCLANGAQKISDEFKEILKKKRIKGFSVESMKETGCHGFCEVGPLVVIEPEQTFYTRVRVKDVDEIVEETLRKNNVVDRLLYRDPKTGKQIPEYPEIEFYKRQHRIALRNIGHMNQCDIREYISRGGYKAASKALGTMREDR